MVWGFPNGDRATYPTFTLESSLGQLQLGMPRSWSTRVPHLLRFVKEGGPPSPDVEINIPTQLNRSISGAYVAAHGSTWLCSRGDFTAFRGKIPRAITFQHFQQWLVDVRDGDRQARVIPVAAVESDRLADDLAEFIQSVLHLKEGYKSGESTPSREAPGWHSGEEFEGTKTTSHGEPSTYEYTHGPLCNGLFRSLVGIVKSRSDLLVRKNRNVDVAIVSQTGERAAMIFEVKTSADLGSQVYSAIGQLLVYRKLHGCDACTMVLVLPQQCRKEAEKLSRFVDPLGIHLLLGDGLIFATVAGLPLNKLVRKYVAR